MFGDGEPPEQRPWLPAEPFGIVDEAGRSVALWRDGELLGYSGAGAMRSLAQAYASWASCGLPGLAGLGLRVMRGAASLTRNGRVWMEKRDRTVLVWSPLSHAEDWKGLLGDAP